MKNVFSKMSKEKNLILLLFISITFNLTAQKLSINETIIYINSTFKNNPNFRMIMLGSDGYIDLYYRQFSQRMHWSEVKVGKYNGDSPRIKFFCKRTSSQNFILLPAPSCIINRGKSSYLKRNKNCKKTFISTNDSYSTNKLYNAFAFLFSELKTSGEYNRNDEDPFAPENFDPKKATVLHGQPTENIELEIHHGVYKVWVKIGNLKKQFVLDSGASEISLSKSTERELISNKIINEKDYVEPALFKLADGSIIKCRRVIIPEMTIGNYRVKDIIASIGVSESPLLLGKNFLDNFNKWSIDNNTKELILER